MNDDEDFEEVVEDDFSEFAQEEMDDQEVLEDVKKKKNQSKQGFKSLVSRKRVSSWDMDEIFLM